MNISKMIIDSSLLSRLNLFRNVTPESIEVYLERSEIIELKAGEILIEPVKENRYIYSLLSGRLQIHLDSVTKPPYTSLGPGECVGELSVIDHKGPSAYVVASEDSRLLAIDHDTLWAMVNVSHAIARNLLFILSGRVRYDNAAISDSFKIQERYEQYAMIDALTGLHNRRWLNEMFVREMHRCAMDDEVLTLAMLDVDYFKQFNDKYGHTAGDLVLSTIASILRKHLRPNDMVARYGGEEFAILFPQTTASEALVIAERLRKCIAEKRLGRYKSQTIPRVTISVGIAQMQPGDILDRLLENADAALYRAKKNGRNCVSR